jgi:hypothetical protein
MNGLQNGLQFFTTNPVHVGRGEPFSYQRRHFYQAVRETFVLFRSKRNSDFEVTLLCVTTLHQVSGTSLRRKQGKDYLPWQCDIST